MTKKTLFHQFKTLCARQAECDPDNNWPLSSDEFVSHVEKEKKVVKLIDEEFSRLQEAGLDTSLLLDDNNENVRYWASAIMLERKQNYYSAINTLRQLSKRSILPWKQPENPSLSSKASMLLKYYGSLTSE